MKAAKLAYGLVFGCSVAIAVCNHADFLHDLAMAESGVNPAVVNPYGYVGLFQMGEAALKDAGYYNGDPSAANDWTGTWTGKNGINSLEDFKASPDGQVQAITDYHNKVKGYIQSLGLDNAVGQTINGVPITLSGLVAGAHLVGIGNLQQFINSNGAIVPKDGNGVPISNYVANFANCDVGNGSPGFAALAGAAGNPVPAPAPAPPAGVGGGPASPSPYGWFSPGGAFANGAGGIAMGQVNLVFSAIVAVFFFVWAAWNGLAMLSGWRRRELSFIEFQSGLVRSMMMLGIVVIIVS